MPEMRVRTRAPQASRSSFQWSREAWQRMRLSGGNHLVVPRNETG
ncbi:hypothetical protein F7R23_03610 [Burkholderia diffusa]|nr:hypothetical protein F7R23_03610 [Burkholderia diffusa]